MGKSGERPLIYAQAGTMIGTPCFNAPLCLTPETRKNYFVCRGRACIRHTCVQSPHLRWGSGWGNRHFLSFLLLDFLFDQLLEFPGKVCCAVAATGKYLTKGQLTMKTEGAGKCEGSLAPWWGRCTDTLSQIATLAVDMRKAVLPGFR